MATGPAVAALGTFRVHHVDGSSEDVRLTSKAVVEAERRWPGIMPDGSDRYRPNEGVHYMIWVTLGRPTGDFDTWLDEGFVVEPVTSSGADPTPPAHGAGRSPNSPPQRASRNGTSRTTKPKTSSRS